MFKETQRKITVLSSVMTAALLSSSILHADTTAQESAPPQIQIVGGGPSQPGARPYTVELRLGSRHWCGGSLIDSQWVLTAAHCVDNFPSNLNVAIGRYDITTTDGENLDVSKIILHPNWNTSNNDNDIALLKLESPTSLDIAPLPLVTSETGFEQPSTGEMLTVMGWGALTQGGSGPNVMHEVDVPLVSNATCNAPAAYDGRITDNMLCAGFPQGGRDSCQGDSGGPIVSSAAGADFQVGIVSWGFGCAQPDKYGVYTRVENYIDWISSTITNDVDPILLFEETNLSASQGEWIHFSADIPASATKVTATLSGGTGDADLYTRPGVQPTTSSYECRPYRNGNNETCTKSSPESGVWFFSLRAYRAFSGATLKVSYE